MISLESEDSYYDLEALAAEVQRDYFPKASLLPIRWGHRINRKKRRSIRLGSYDHRTSEIRIHPSLNTPIVPRYFIQSIIHHEYLHHVLGARHNRRFHAQERRYRFHRESQLWLKRNLPLLLGRKARPVLRPVGESAAPRQMALF
ncbi:MAG TPA: hypothetical protein VMS12_02235 [Thermoanaerobaculia bacterium]|nr:hypothetical protein [Thermoanaerobaculia bacterium]